MKFLIQGVVMSKIFIIFIFSMLLNIQPIFSQTNNLNMSVGTAFNSKHLFSHNNNLRTSNKSNINFNLEYSKRNLTSQLSLNFDDYNRLSFDKSYINYEKGMANLSIGKVDRIWSFSKKSSLILSSNSRPLKTISLNLENKFNTNWLPLNSNWSVEIINSSTKNSFNGNNSILTGARVIIRPSEQLNFEFIKTAQWGDQNDKLYLPNINALLPINTNVGKYANMNKMAGFGLSYSIPFQEKVYHFYSQVIGEDEAGNLPSCYAWMAGLELTAPMMKFPTTVSLEAIDTRVNESTHGNCGTNTMYNNNTYNYTNYGTVLGVPIDTESTSLELFGTSQINNNLSINYSTKFLSINDSNNMEHRLSSKRASGTVTSLGIYWKKNGFDFGGDISYQDLILNKASISNDTVLSLFTSVEF